MEKAVEVMRLSVPERRDDGKPSPKVGAVLLRKNGSIEAACRGELREGNHAEYTLLERKCIGELVQAHALYRHYKVADGGSRYRCAMGKAGDRGRAAGQRRVPHRRGNGRYIRDRSGNPRRIWRRRLIQQFVVADRNPHERRDRGSCRYGFELLPFFVIEAPNWEFAVKNFFCTYGRYFTPAKSNLIILVVFPLFPTKNQKEREIAQKKCIFLFLKKIFFSPSVLISICHSQCQSINSRFLEHHSILNLLGA